MKSLNTLAPSVIGQASKEIDKIAEARIRQVINDGGQKSQEIAPQIIRGAIEGAYKAPFRYWVNSANMNFHSLNENCHKYSRISDREINR